MPKDRSKHEAARGKKAAKLTDLSRELPTEDEVVNFQKLLAVETDRGAAIMAGAYTENALYVAVAAKLVDPGSVILKQWFEAAGAPFSTFASKITLGRALGIFGADMERRLSLVKDIRNQFAHSARPINFQHPVVVSACKKLTPSGEQYQKLSGRRIYVAATLALASVLIKYAMKHGGKEIEVHFP